MEVFEAIRNLYMLAQRAFEVAASDSGINSEDDVQRFINEERYSKKKRK